MDVFAAPLSLHGNVLTKLSVRDRLPFYQLPKSQSRQRTTETSVQHYNDAIDWMELRTRSSEWRASAYVYLALYLAKELLDARIPHSFLNDFEPAGFDRALIQWAKERLLRDCEPSPVSSNLVQLCWKGRRFRERVAALRSTLAPEVVAKSYGLAHDWNRFFVYYPVRIKDLLIQYGPVLWRLMAGDQEIRAAAEREENQLRLTKWLSSGYQ
jgi:hypothetical protein